MSLLNKVARFFTVSDNPDLVQAQAHAVSRQVPLMYSMLLANTLALAATHFRSSPAMLSVYVPAALTLICAVRLVFWWRNRNRSLAPEKARKALANMIWLSAVLAIGFVSWALWLYRYGNPYQQSHVAFFIGITTIGCMFCLNHVRAASMLVGLLGVVPFATFFATTGNATFVAIAINLALVVAALVVILLGNHRDFAALVKSRTEMSARQIESQRLSDENYRLANIDSLTGLPNRRWFDRQLAAALETAQAQGTQIAVGRLDLDSFKSVNDIFGQITGDQVLVEVGRRLRALSHPSTLVSRFGNDSFSLILVNGTDSEALHTFGDVLTAAMRSSFDMEFGNVHLSASAGFATSRPGDTADTLYDRADYVTWVAKRDRRGQAIVFAERHAVQLNQVRSMEHALRTADLDAEIYIVFQPQFDIALNRITGYEVLARWCSPLVGEVSPVQFIPMAERIGLIGKITQTVLRKALIVSAKLPKTLRLSVNLSANDLGSTTAVEAIVEQVQRAGTPCRVDFEITETAVMRDVGQACEGLLALLALGSRIALDDFGTGHSSLTHVQKLPLDRIKVDRSFVNEVTNDPTSRAIVKTTVDLCRNLGISCVFEGIETEQQLNALLALGGTVMQGYFFGRPMTEDMLFRQVAEGQSGHSRPSALMYGAAS